MQSLKGHLRLPQQIRDVLLSYRLAVHLSQEDDLLHLAEGLLHSTPIVLHANRFQASRPTSTSLSSHEGLGFRVYLSSHEGLGFIIYPLIRV